MTSALLYQLKGLIFIAIGLFGIGFLVGFHEFGHFIFAKVFGVRVPSFSIGMGPKIFSKKIGETEFKLSAIPIGGYVEIAGLAEIGQGEQKEAQITNSGSFQTKPYWQKFLIMSGGIIFNFVLALVIFFGLFATGMPKSLLSYPEEVKPIIVKTQKDSLAEKIGLQSGDTILAIDNQKTENVLQVIALIQENKNKTVSITINRAGRELSLKALLDFSGRFGLDYRIDYLTPFSFTASVKNAWNMTLNVTKKTFDVFINLFKKRTTDGVAGPLLIISQMVQNAKQGASIFLLLLAFISINLAIINLIPLPVTDGGQIVFITIEAIIKRQIPENIRLIIHNISWVLILALATYLTIKDSIALFWPTIKNFFM
jgi:regulator of sigma E protease